MNKNSMAGMSARRTQLVWEKVKGILEYAHLGDYLLHPSHSDILALTIFSLKTPAGWAVLGWMLALYFFLRAIRSAQATTAEKKRSAKPRDHRKCAPPKPRARKRPDKSLKSPKKRKDR